MYFSLCHQNINRIKKKQISAFYTYSFNFFHSLEHTFSHIQVVYLIFVFFFFQLLYYSTVFGFLSLRCGAPDRKQSGFHRKTCECEYVVFVMWYDITMTSITSRETDLRFESSVLVTY